MPRLLEHMKEAFFPPSVHVGVPSAVTKLGAEPSSVARAALTTSIYCGCISCVLVSAARTITPRSI